MRVKIVRKSAVWSKHGKHARIDPVLLNRKDIERPKPVYYSSMKALWASGATRQTQRSQKA